MSNKFFFRSAFISTILSYLLIFVGGLVRVSGSGLGCPDWPKCFGRWVPPTSIEQIPAHIDPTAFNIVLAWIEYGNRMLGVIVGISILSMTIIAVIYFKKNSKISYKEIIQNDKVAKVSIVGAGMVSTPGVTYRMFRALSDEEINILAISTSEIKLSVIIEEDNIFKAIKKLHTTFDLD